MYHLGLQPEKQILPNIDLLAVWKMHVEHLKKKQTTILLYG